MNAAQNFLLADTWMHGGWGWGWMMLMMIVMVLFWGVVIYGIFWLIRSTAQGNSTSGEPPGIGESPLDVLGRRFAEGAITEEEYRVRRQVLVGDRAGSNRADKDEPVAVR